LSDGLENSQAVTKGLTMRVPETPPEAVANEGSADKQVTELLLQKNPFYLISAAMVIHGSGFWFKAWRWS
jgi:hypothetical protein